MELFISKKTTALALSLISCFASPTVSADLIISEFLASNSGAQGLDEDKFPGDWIEIHNSGNTSRSLNGYHLTDNATNPTKWTFPSVTLPAGAYLRVWATSKDRKSNPAALHTNFSLSSNGEYLALVEPDGVSVASHFSPTYPPQFTDISYGLGNGGPLLNETILTVDSPLTYFVPTQDIGSSWQLAGYDDSSWTNATGGLGYNYPWAPLGTNGDTRSAMFDINASIYVRIPFQVTDPNGIGSLTLRVKVDDGFAAFLNGQLVASKNAPTPLTFDATATANEGVDPGDPFEEYPLNVSGKLLAGENILAIQGINRASRNNDFLFVSELVGEVQDLTPPFPFGYFTSPTPAVKNGAPSFAPPSEVEFDLTSQAFTENFSVSLSTADPDAVIRFTTDGSRPSTTSPTYTSPILIDRSTVVRARTYRSGSLPSEGRSEGFLKMASSEANFSSNLPVILISTLGKGGPPDSGSTAFREVFLMIYEPDPVTGRTTLDGPPSIATRGGYRKRGSTSANFPKYPLRFESWDEKNEEKDIAPFGFAPEGDWIFDSRYTFDVALIRNPLIYHLSNQVGRWAVKTQQVELYNDISGPDANASDYFGVYTLMERTDPKRLEIPSLDPWENTPEEITGSYIFKNDRASPGVPGLSVSGFQSALDLTDPNGLEITSAQRTYLQTYLNQTTTALRATNGINTSTGLHYSDYIDIPSFIDNFWLNLFAMNPDWGRLSQFFYKPRGEKIHAGPIWDFDRTMGSRDSRDANPNRWEGPTSDTSFAWYDSRYEWFGRLFGFNPTHNQTPNMPDPQARTSRPDEFQKVIDRWYQLRSGAFSTAYVHSVIDEMAAEISEAQARNFTRWSALNPGSIQGINYAAPGTTGWQREISHLKGWITARTSWIDSRFFGPPSFSQNGGPVDENFNLVISSPHGNVYYTTDGSDPRAPGGSPSPSAIRSSNAILAESSTVTARTYDGNQWSAPKTSTFFVGSIPADSSSIVISEIMYHPADPTADELAAGFLSDNDFEYLEILNISDLLVDLTNVSVSDGIVFDFANASITELAPGQRLLIVESRDAFLFRYGNHLASQIAGEFTSGRLSNSGERLALSSPAGTIVDLTYTDDYPWPESPDGDGPSLVLIQPTTAPDPSIPTNWRASVSIQGNPGVGDALTFTGDPTADLDGDGLNAFAEYALGTDDNVPDSMASLIETNLDLNRRFNIIFPKNLAADDAQIIVQISTDLINWTPAGEALEFDKEVHLGNGTARYEYRTPTAAANQPRFFARLLITER